MKIIEKLKRKLLVNETKELVKRIDKYEKFILKVKSWLKTDKKRLKQLLKELTDEEITLAWDKAGIKWE